MPSTSAKPFHVLVVLGAAAVGSAAGCDPQAEPVDPDAATRTPGPPAPARAADPPTTSDRVASTSSAQRDDAPSCESACAGEGVECSANGVLCCWGHDPCCGSCCG